MQSGQDTNTHQKKLHVILLLNDDETISCKTVTLDDTDSVAQALREVGQDKKILSQLDSMKSAVRLYDGKVFVDNREQALWMLGHLDHKPADAQSTVVTH